MFAFLSRFDSFAVKNRNKRRKDVSLYYGMEQCEQYSDEHGKNEAERKVVVNKFRDQQSAEQCTEKPETHGNGEGEILQNIESTLCASAYNACSEDDNVGKHAHCNCGVNVGDWCGKCY